MDELNLRKMDIDELNNLRERIGEEFERRRRGRVMYAYQEELNELIEAIRSNDFEVIITPNDPELEVIDLNNDEN